MIRKMHCVNGPDFDADALKRKDRRAISNVPVGNAGLNRHHGQGHGQDLQMTKIDNCQWNIIIGLVSTNLSQPIIPSRILGTGGPAVSAVGLGCMGMSDFYGPADESESVATVHAALDAGINLLDTGDFYGMGH